MDKRNLGRFSVSTDFIEGFPDDAAAVFAFMRIVPLRVERRVDTCNYDYLAYCEAFDALDAGEAAPFYTLEIEKKGGLIVRVDARKGD